MSKKRCTYAGLAMLKILSHGLPWNSHLRGQSEHGGGESTLAYLHRNEYVSGEKYAPILTPKGRQAIENP